MRIAIRLGQNDLERLVREHIRDKLGVNVTDVTIYVKSTQNYRAKWEKCSVIVVNDEGRQVNNEAHPKDPLPEPELKVEVEAE